MVKRILILGITGVAKDSAATRLSSYSETTGHALKIINFDKQFLFSDEGAGSVPRNTFLASQPPRQRELWSAAWAKVLSEVQGDNSDIALSMHGTYIQGFYGSRWIFDPRAVCQLKPDLIVTLIADVYDMWWRTESRAQRGEAWKGRPTLEQLILGRRFEVAAGDQIALTAGCKHLVLAVGHPCDTLTRCIFRPRPKVTYLSFPISEPRRMADLGDTTGLEEVSGFIKLAHDRQKASNHLACICPLAIDELPLVKEFDRFKKERENSQKGEMPDEMAFDRDALRWPLTRFWHADELLDNPPKPHCNFNVEQIQNAAGSIKTDVGWRDFRLVEQANFLAVFNPVYNNAGRVSRGVKSEIDFATGVGCPVYYFQDPRHDESGVCDDHLNPTAGGSMGEGPGPSLITRVDTAEGLFDAIARA